MILQRGEIVSKEFRIIDQVGEGTYSNVYSVINIYSQKNYVIKACRNKPSYNESHERKFQPFKIDTVRD